MQRIFCLLSCFVFHAKSSQIKSYFLNQNYDYKNPLCTSCQDMDCLLARNDQSLKPGKKITICYRSFPMRYTGTNTWSTVFGFGQINDDYTGMKEGYIFGVWETGPWIGYKGLEDTAHEWLALGENFLHDVQIWRHSCLSLDFETGDIKLVENGEILYKSNSTSLIKLSMLSDVTVGCYYYKPSGLMSMYGRATDMQMFSKVLSDKYMKQITNCKKRMEGDILNWDKTDWITRGNGNLGQESLEFEENVCAENKHGLCLIPYTRNFVPEGIHTCRKLSGKMAEYSSKDQFEAITKYLSTKELLHSNKCKEDDVFSTWLGNNDAQKEGYWKTYFSNKDVLHLPWEVGRPYSGGVKYNCMRLKIKAANTGGRKEMMNAVVTDEECEHQDYCPLCQIDKPTLKIFVRGLCWRSDLDKVYIWNMDSDGNIVYLGERTSTITYSKQMKQWVWYDNRDNTSVATSAAPESSLLLGVHEVDFSGVIEDKCRKHGIRRLVKLTTCEDGQFTCNGGLCVPLESRCDKTVDCGDGSDEKNCKIAEIKDTYDGNTPPFTYDAVNKM